LIISVSVCRLGYTCRCPEGALFGSPALEGGQAQYVRVPKAGGTLFNLTDPKSWSSTASNQDKEMVLTGIADTSLLMLADILPTGVFAALQALNHPKVLPVVTGRPWPLSFFPNEGGSVANLKLEDRVLTFAIIGLGPVGVCACVSLLDMLAMQNLPFRVVAIDPLEARREKMEAVIAAIDEQGKGSGDFVVLSIEDAKKTVQNWTAGVGCNAVLEVSLGYFSKEKKVLIKK
jgi:threonine dehydrogenase-like Zn-dependent dehydrogenase